MALNTIMLVSWCLLYFWNWELRNTGLQGVMLIWEPQEILILSRTKSGFQGNHLYHFWWHDPNATASSITSTSHLTRGLLTSSERGQSFIQMKPWGQVLATTAVPLMSHPDNTWSWEEEQRNHSRYCTDTPLNTVTPMNNRFGCNNLCTQVEKWHSCLPLKQSTSFWSKILNITWIIILFKRHAVNVFTSYYIITS